MPLEKYKILQAPIEDGTSYIPGKAIPLGIWTLQELPEGAGGFIPGQVPIVQYKVNLAFMMKYEDWAEEFPEEAEKEEEEEVKKTEAQQAGAANVE